MSQLSCLLCQAPDSQSTKERNVAIDDDFTNCDSGYGYLKCVTDSVHDFCADERVFFLFKCVRFEPVLGSVDQCNNRILAVSHHWQFVGNPDSLPVHPCRCPMWQHSCRITTSCSPVECCNKQLKQDNSSWTFRCLGLYSLQGHPKAPHSDAKCVTEILGGEMRK